MLIDDVIKTLSKSDFDKLKYCFESSCEGYVTLEDNKFIGVNICDNSNLDIELASGSWCYGEILKEEGDEDNIIRT